MPQQAATSIEPANAGPPEPSHRDSAVLSTVPSRDSQVTPASDIQRATAVTEGQKKPRTSSKPIKTMPLRYETCDPKDLGVLIADMLMELIRLNDKIPLKDGKLTRFHSR